MPLLSGQVKDICREKYGTEGGAQICSVGGPAPPPSRFI